MANDVIIALDFPTREETLTFLDRFPDGERKPFVKTGMELFYAGGPSIVREIKARGHKIFLDLKLHDIPNTVKRAMSVLSGLDVDMVNLHAAGGSVMMKAALEGLTRPDGSRPMLIAVTQLTSTDSAMLKNELLIDTPMAETVLSYARTAAASGLDGVVCSPLEAALVKERCGEAFCTVTPGIRFAGSAAGDQKRVMSPEQAAKNGCDYIVMGRPITQALDPAEAYRRACRDFLGLQA
ncbi:MAG: orotidine-5'-phosphate decarboxylase [Oscillibacter sp.]|nr:orotidine-5'-phosphate decarboxylase [Oscillibacter sp.]